MEIKFILVDDHILFREGLKVLLEINPNYKILGEAGDGNELMEIIKTCSPLPDVILMDIHMPNCNGIEATKRIKEKYPQIKVVILSICEEDESLAEAIQLGAEGYLLKNLRKENLFNYLDGLFKGENPISPKMVTKMLQRVANDGIQPKKRENIVVADPNVTDREKEVLEFLVLGYTNKEIAAKLEITINTVKYHLKNMMKKLNVVNRVQLIAVAVQQCIVTEEK